MAVEIGVPVPFKSVVSVFIFCQASLFLIYASLVLVSKYVSPLLALATIEGLLIGESFPLKVVVTLSGVAFKVSFTIFLMVSSSMFLILSWATSLLV